MKYRLLLLGLFALPCYAQQPPWTPSSFFWAEFCDDKGCSDAPQEFQPSLVRRNDGQTEKPPGQISGIVHMSKEGNGIFLFRPDTFKVLPDCELGKEYRDRFEIHSITKERIIIIGPPLTSAAFECSTVPFDELRRKQFENPSSFNALTIVPTIAIDPLAQALVNIGVDPALAAPGASLFEALFALAKANAALTNTSLTNLNAQLAALVPLPATSYVAVSGALPTYEWGPCIPQRDFSSPSAGESFDYPVSIPAAGNYMLVGCVGTGIIATVPWSLHFEYPIGTNLGQLNSSSILSPLTNWSVFRQVPCPKLVNFSAPGNYTVRVVLETANFNWGGLMQPVKQ